MTERDGYEAGTPSWADVMAPDIEKTTAFYGGLFGWEAVAAGDPESTGGYTIFLKDGKSVAGAMAGSAPGPVPAVWSTYIATDDADATAEKVKAAGGTVMMEPMDVMTAGRMGFFVDPTGGAIGVWQAGDHRGAQLVNEPGTMCWNELRTRDPEAAKSFYADVFGWGAEAFEGTPGYSIWMVGEAGVGGVMDMAVAEMPAEVPPHWGVVFAVADVDQSVATAQELGATVTTPPFDFAVGRLAGLIDPQGAAFSIITLAEQAEG